jgi:hypothetical protein
MKTCRLDDFIQEITPWLSSDYIQKAYLDDKGHFVLMFVDGVRNAYHIQDCTEAQIKAVLKDLKQKGIAVEE